MWPGGFRIIRHEESVLARIRIGHIHFTHVTPQYRAFDCRLAVKHILLDCMVDKVVIRSTQWWYRISRVWYLNLHSVNGFMSDTIKPISFANHSKADDNTFYGPRSVLHVHPTQPITCHEISND